MERIVFGIFSHPRNVKPTSWFDNNRPLGLVTKTFPGEDPGQYSAREFFTRKGFKQIGEDADHLYYPLKAGFVYRPVEKKEAKYVASR